MMNNDINIIDVKSTTDEIKTTDIPLKTLSSSVQNKNEKYAPVHFDDALTQTKFGKFNYFLILISGTILTAVLMETLGISFVLPVSQCDLKLTTSDKGILSAIGFVGIISSSHLWGFLADTKGRRRVILPTLFIAFLCSIMSSLTNSFWIFLILRFFNGFFISGSSATVYAYLGEFHNFKNRSRVIMFASVIFGITCVMLPVIAYLVINQEWEFYIPLINVIFKPWRLFLVVCSLPSLFCSISLIGIPESPKFVLSQGNQEETILILQKINRINNGKKALPLELHSIIEEPTDNAKTNGFINSNNIENNNTTAAAAVAASASDNRTSKSKNPFSIFKLMWNQTAPLFMQPHLKKTIIVCTMQFGIYISANGLYMWFPEILNRSAEFMDQHPGQSVSLCDIVYSTRLNITAIEQTEYENNNNNNNLSEMNNCTTKLEMKTYQYTFVLEILYAVGFAFIGAIINAVGKLPIIFTTLAGCGICGVAIVFVDIPSIGIYLYLILLLCGLAVSVVNAVTIDLFPTNLRAMAVCISLMVGRLGSVVGANIAGILLDYHCQYMFLSSGFIAIGCGILAFFIPNIRQRHIVNRTKTTTTADNS